MPIFEISPELSIHYTENNPAGRPTVVLLHGLGADCSSWQLQIPALVQAGYRILAPDARGFGKSSCPTARISIRVMADDFARLIKSNCNSPVHLAGISMGGVHALQLCLDHPELIDKLVLVNTFASLRPEKPSVWVFLIFRFIMVHTLGLHAQARYVTGRIFPNSEQAVFRDELYRQILQVDPKVYRATMRALAVFSVGNRLHEITKPTLVVTGEKDSTVPPKNQRFLADHIQGANQIIVPDAGHAVIVDQPAIFNKIILDFLDDSIR